MVIIGEGTGDGLAHIDAKGSGLNGGGGDHRATTVPYLWTPPISGTLALQPGGPEKFWTLLYQSLSQNRTPPPKWTPHKSTPGGRDPPKGVVVVL